MTKSDKICDLIRQGHTNAEIAMAVDAKPSHVRTVRNERMTVKPYAFSSARVAKKHSQASKHRWKKYREARA